jgi:hypothetical protein
LSRRGTATARRPNWTPPQRPRLTVITALRDDSLGRMFARQQIDRAQFEADREISGASGRGRNAQPAQPRPDKAIVNKLHGSQIAEPVSDWQRHRAARLHKVSLIVIKRFGLAGLLVTRAVLADQAGLNFGEQVGFASSARPSRHHPSRDLHQSSRLMIQYCGPMIRPRRSGAAAGTTGDLIWL